jgi:hypothetical protein
MVSLIWIKILDEIKTKNSSFLAINEIEEICAVYSLSSAEIAEMLTFFYEMGILIWINEEKLRDIVILDPIEYFVKPATMIICKHIATKDDPYHTVHCEEIHKACREEWPEDWYQMLEYGLVSERLARKLLGSACKDEKHLNKVLFLMERFGLVSPLLVMSENKDSPSCFFVPSITPDDPSNYMVTKDCDYKVLTTGLLLKRASCSREVESVVFHFGFSVFSDLLQLPLLSSNDLSGGGFLPNGLFERFIGRLFGVIIDQLSNKELCDFLNRNNFIAFKNMVKLRYKSREVKIVNLLTVNMIRIEVEKGDGGLMEKGLLQSIHDSLRDVLQPIVYESFKNLAVVTLLPVNSLDYLKQPLLPLRELFYVVADTKNSIDYHTKDRKQSFHCRVVELKGLFRAWLEVPVVECEYDVFLSHDWGKDNINHEKVKIINKALKKKGLITWFDEEQMEGNIVTRMTEGIEKAKCVLVFITENYRKKVNGSEERDNCYREFSHAVVHKGPQKMISIVMEKEMRNPSEWKRLLGVSLQNHLFYDFSEINFPPSTSSSSTSSASASDLDEVNSSFKMKIENLFDVISQRLIA